MSFVPALPEPLALPQPCLSPPPSLSPARAPGSEGHPQTRSMSRLVKVKHHRPTRAATAVLAVPTRGLGPHQSPPNQSPDCRETPLQGPDGAPGTHRGSVGQSGVTDTEQGCGNSPCCPPPAAHPSPGCPEPWTGPLGPELSHGQRLLLLLGQGHCGKGWLVLPQPRCVLGADSGDCPELCQGSPEPIPAPAGQQMPAQAPGAVVAVRLGRALWQLGIPRPLQLQGGDRWLFPGTSLHWGGGPEALPGLHRGCHGDPSASWCCVLVP